MVNRSFLVILSIILIESCSNEEQEKTEPKNLNQFSWLLGNWKDSSSSGIVIEKWTKANDSILLGNGIMIVKNDTVFSEKLSIEIHNNECFYVPTVANQNNGKSVWFKLLESNDQGFVFENKTHDFPQRIIYKNQATDSLQASVEGTDKGVFRKEEFFIKRITKN